MSFNLSFLASKASAILGTVATYLGAGLALASQFAPTVLPVLSPKAQAIVGTVLVAVGHVQTVLTSSILPKVNAIAAVGSLNPPAAAPPTVPPPAAA
jgi:hypothetical protein